ncbi:MAG TPA: tRNA preQ1(34) S-adenosylmethionine ribosyltransferase-isomerase QueA [Alphaproteobacteria bacterium]|nr:tRNA preQ1(34) S-adenosylmethionine ribosyltransferase-isomerase QueA [Alphaproteobacteria bacterium]
MRVELFDFELPQSRIALRPAEPRDSARLLHVDAGGGLHDHGVRNLPALLAPGDLLVFNDTRVIPAQLAGRRGQARIELTLHRRQGPGRWLAFARPAKRLHDGDIIEIAADFQARVDGTPQAGEVALDFMCDDDTLSRRLEAHGEMPLPPYIRRRRGSDARDRSDYQTVFARAEGAVAAPTAGLHFTDRLLRALQERGVGRAGVTLHVGAGTFLPVTAEDTSAHRMHAEYGEVSEGTAEAVRRTRTAGGRVVAIGTTSLRLLESAAGLDGSVHPFAAETDIFITPGYRFRAVDLLLTNFHLPRSTLFMLVSAFSGLGTMQAAYRHAIDAGYRFYSYGDACLLERAAA